jgi:hypothetical protein
MFSTRVVLAVLMYAENSDEARLLKSTLASLVVLAVLIEKLLGQLV